VPRTRAELEALPGVGPKTASVVLNIVYGEPAIAVDTHVHRVANRLGMAATRSPEQTAAVLLARTPDRFLRHAHHYLILHGRYTCTARAPRCPACPVRRWCLFPDKTPA
jgi:endonuclease-3